MEVNVASDYFLIFTMRCTRLVYSMVQGGCGRRSSQVHRQCAWLTCFLKTAAPRSPFHTTLLVRGQAASLVAVGRAWARTLHRHTGKASHSSTIGGAVGTFESLTKQVGVSVVGFSGLLIVNRPRDRFGSFRHVDNTSNPEDAGGDGRSDVPLELRLPDEPR